MDIENLLLELDSNIQPIGIHKPTQKTENDDLSEIIKLSLPKIKVIGVGGAGNNFTTALYKSNDYWKIVEIIAINTDAGQLAISKAHKRILIGKNTTKGHGAGNDPSLGFKAFQESKEKIRDLIENTDLLIVCAGLGGGTGSGVAPALVELSKEMKILTMSFVTIPFKCEGKVRINNALMALGKIIPNSTVTIVVPNERLIKLASRKTLQNAFNMANNLLTQLVRSLSDLIEKPGLINVDFSDVRKILSYHGLALPGVAISNGSDEKRAISVAEKIINNPLLEVNPALGRGALIEIVSGEDLLLTEAYDIVNKFTAIIGEDKEVIFGLRIDPLFKNKIKVTSLITGIEIIGDDNNGGYLQLADGAISSTTMFEELNDIPTLK
ncbi:MAG: cell division protein FtsZ [Candidatus Njordarchaeota archaeon]